MKNIVFLIMFLFSSCANGDSFIVLQERETYDLRIGERDGIVQVGCILWRDKVIFFPIEKGQEIRFSEISGLNIFAKTSVSEHKMSKAGIYILRKDKSIVYSSSTDLFKRVKNDCVWLDSNGEESSAIRTHSMQEIEYGVCYTVDPPLLVTECKSAEDQVAEKRCVVVSERRPWNFGKRNPVDKLTNFLRFPHQ